jgi:hypothetical protein
MFTLFCSGHCPGNLNPYCCILRSPSDCFLHSSDFVAVHSTQFKPAPRLPGRRLGGSLRLSSRRRLSSSSPAGCLTILVVFTLRHCIVMIDRRSAMDSNSIADSRFTGLVTGKKGMKIWKLIGGSWLCQSVSESVSCRPKLCQTSMKKTNYCHTHLLASLS